MYVRTVGKQTLTFCCSGMLWRGNVVMLALETRRLWSHSLGQAMEGPVAGTTLDVPPSTLTDWESWQKAHPDTTVLWLPRTADRFHRGFYRDLSQFVIGMARDGDACAWPFDELQQQPVLNDEFAGQPVLVLFADRSATATIWSRTVDGRTLTFRADGLGMRDEPTGSFWQRSPPVAVAGPLRGRRLRPLPGIVSCGDAWTAFHPKTRLGTAPR